ncbi:hypothetical protein G9A89_021785 [Geosiphon pyriformis]|nr:hypothetical protein G9A89_021785 [Geosiphon pyriformis]
MVPGHTKFKCDGSFGLIKRLYRKTTVDCVDHIVKVVKMSSTAGLNKAQCYENGKGFQYLDLNSVLGIFFKKLSGLQKYQHIVFEAAKPGIVKVQLVANDDPNEKTNIQRLASGELKRIRNEKETQHYSEQHSFYDRSPPLSLNKELLQALKDDLFKELIIVTAFKKKPCERYPIGKKKKFDKTWGQFPQAKFDFIETKVVLEQELVQSTR